MVGSQNLGSSSLSAPIVLHIKDQRLLNHLKQNIRELGVSHIPLVLTDQLAPPIEQNRHSYPLSPPIFYIDHEFNEERMNLVSIGDFTSYLSLTSCPTGLLTKRIIRWITLLNNVAMAFSNINNLEQYQEWKGHYLAAHPLTILCVDDDSFLLETMAKSITAITPYKINVLTAESPDDAKQLAQEHQITLSFLDIYYGKAAKGYELFDYLDRPLNCIFMTAQYAHVNAIEEITNGALDFLEKPLMHLRYRNLMRFYLEYLSELTLLETYIKNEQSANN